jgi:ribulose 1,5-bisphosphate synthetase/thiazole synthase
VTIVAEAQQHYVQHRWEVAAQLLQQVCVRCHSLLRASELGGNRVQTGLATGELSHQGFPKHAGIAGGVFAWHPTLIAKEHIDPIPWQVLLTK